MSTNELTDSLKDLSLKNDATVPEKTSKPKASYDKVALKERWKILGTDPEQSKSYTNVYMSIKNLYAHQ